MDDDVEVGRQLGHVLEVPGDDGDPLGERGEGVLLADRLAPAAEDGLAEQLLRAALGGEVPAGPDEDADARRRVGGQQLLDDGLADEAGGARDEDVRVLQR